MELADFCSSSRVIIVAGKGGVGKTTVAAALAVAAARAGKRALLVELEADRYVVYGVVTEICVRIAAFGLLKG